MKEQQNYPRVLSFLPKEEGWKLESGVSSRREERRRKEERRRDDFNLAIMDLTRLPMSHS